MDSVLYTDGHGTRVTSEEFVTHNARYLIRGIIDARMNKMHASPFPALACFCFGLLLAALGFFHVLDNSASVLPQGDMSVTASQLAIFAGFIFTGIGILALALRQRKYSVHITTAEGERDPVVSRKQDYVRQIVVAIQNALTERDLPGPIVSTQPLP